MSEQRRVDGSTWDGELFRLLVENVRDYAIFVVDPDGLVRTWSDGAERLLGYREDEILGRSADVFFTPEDLAADAPRREIREAAEAGRGVVDRWHVRKDETRFWCSGVTTPLKDEAGRPRGFAKILRDRTEWWHAEQARLESEERLRTAFAHAAVGMATTDPALRFLEANRAFGEITGYTAEELIRKELASIIHPDDWPKKQRLLRQMLEGAIPSFVIEKRYVRKDGAHVWTKSSVSLVRDDRGQPRQIIILVEHITRRKEAEAKVAEQVRLAEFGRDIGLALTESASTGEMLDRVVVETVRHLEGAFARIWTAAESGEVLELRASAGLYTHLDGPHSRVPVGMYKIGQIARERKPHLTNSVIGDLRVPAQEWAEREGMVAFAGYPLVVDDRLVGVWAMFSRHPLSEATLKAMESVANGIALGIERKRTMEILAESESWLSTTLASIGDAVIATDDQGRVRFMNRIAEALTGWPQAEASGLPIHDVFHIVNERTRQAAEHPILRVIREGVIVGLANHTVLVSKGGAETPIEDSAAPIRGDAGKLAGVVMVFRDVTEERAARRLPPGERGAVPHDGRVDPPTGVDGATGWPYLLVQPALV